MVWAGCKMWPVIFLSCEIQDYSFLDFILFIRMREDLRNLLSFKMSNWCLEQSHTQSSYTELAHPNWLESRSATSHPPQPRLLSQGCFTASVALPCPWTWPSGWRLQPAHSPLPNTGPLTVGELSQGHILPTWLFASCCISILNESNSSLIGLA